MYEKKSYTNIVERIKFAQSTRSKNNVYTQRVVA